MVQVIRQSMLFLQLLVCVCLSHSHYCGRSAVHLLLQLHHLLHVLGLGQDETGQSEASEFPTEACYPKSQPDTRWADDDAVGLLVIYTVSIFDLLDSDPVILQGMYSFC